ncbi:MAG: DUF2867 domain-containing protein [Betaproteobacteria bacterium]|nr:DUF2867 domain-containing protein [Betaproteobacteria bacterium]
MNASAEPTATLAGTSVLVLGASGYVGTHLVPLLLAQGARVRAAARRLGALQARGWDGVETIAADALAPASLDAALQGVQLAYYLVHSMAGGADFARRDRQAAQNFAAAAARAGVRRIVYLGGLQPRGQASAHLASRVETGDVLRQGPVPVTELRAGVIIGPGSAAFEVIRDLVLHLPGMFTPRCVSSRSQPIALDDVLAYLTRLPLLPQAAGASYDIGGPEVLTYKDMMLQFGALVGRRPLIVPLPLLKPRLFSHGLPLVTTVPTPVARALIEGLEHDVLADDAAIHELVPLKLLSYRQAAQAALDRERRAAQAAQANPSSPHGPRWTEGDMVYRRQRADFAFYARQMRAQATAVAPAAVLWQQVQQIGGDNGYYFLDVLWQVRGRLDQLLGGQGLRKGRPAAHALRLGDAVDFWRVVALEPGRRLSLLAEMKLPGAATLDFEVLPQGERRSQVCVTATFHPAGAPGLAYWHALTPVHAVLFPGLAQALARRAAQAAAARTATPAA